MIIIEYKIPLSKKHERRVEGYKGIEAENKRMAETTINIRGLESKLQYLNIRELSEILVENTTEFGDDFTLLTNQLIMYRNVIAHTSILSDRAEKEFKLLFSKIIKEARKFLIRKKKSPPDSEM